MWIIYKYTSPSGKSYIGQTSRDPKKRARHGEGYKDSPRFYNAIQKYGFNSFQFEIIAYASSKQEANQLEQDYIALYKTTDPNFGYNLSSGGDGLIANEATKERMRESHLGKKHTEETKQKISTALKQYERSEEHQKHLTAALQMPHLGFDNHKHTERAKELIAAAHSKKVQCVETGEIFDSAEQAVKKLNMKSNHINDCINNPKRYKTSGGYHWIRYKEKNMEENN